MWNFSGQSDPVQENSIPVMGQISDIEVIQNNVMWATNEPLLPDKPDLTVGMAYLYDNETGPVPLKVSSLIMSYSSRIISIHDCSDHLKCPTLTHSVTS